MQQEALRGQALILKQQGDIAAAEQLLADMAQREQEPDCMSQHLAQTDYGTLLLEQGNPQVLSCFSDAAGVVGIRDACHCCWVKLLLCSLFESY